MAGSKEPRTNGRIRANEVRIIGATGEQLGVKPLAEALEIASDAGLDLVEVSAVSEPPVCKVMDYSKFKYEAAQKAKETRKKTKNTVVKEMKYRPKIGHGDFETKTRKVEQFLEDGNKVKITIMFRGREVAHPDQGRRILQDIVDRVEHFAQVETLTPLEGRNMVMVLAPLGKKHRKKKAKVTIGGDDESSAVKQSQAGNSVETVAESSPEAVENTEQPAPTVTESTQ